MGCEAQLSGELLALDLLIYMRTSAAGTRGGTLEVVGLDVQLRPKRDDVVVSGLRRGDEALAETARRAERLRGRCEPRRAN
jgi:hypothetical protein